jgi:hypothetical protein
MGSRRKDRASEGRATTLVCPQSQWRREEAEGTWSSLSWSLSRKERGKWTWLFS